MLIYETEGFLEVESKDIKQLCRSTASVSLGDPERESYSVQVILCDSLANSEQRCRVAFYAKTLNRALVFAVKGTERQSPWQHAQETLSQLGFQLEDINLKLSPAMLEVVLRDVPGLLSPAAARKQRTEKALLITELKNTYEKNPDNAQGQKAALKLSTERRLDDRSAELHQLLEGLFSPQEDAGDEVEALISQVKDLTARLTSAEALAETERSQREMSESITNAAEKRIQELEEILVDVETKSSDTLKQKRKVLQLQGRIKELGEELDSSRAETTKEAEKQEQFITDIKNAHQQIATLKSGLRAAEQALENVQTELSVEQAERNRLSVALEESDKNSAQHDGAQKASVEAQAQLDELKQALSDALDHNNALEADLSAAVEQRDELSDSLQKAQLAVSGQAENDAQVKTLSEHNEQLARDISELNDKYDLECSVRKRLEKGALEEDRRIRELEESLSEMTRNAADVTNARSEVKAETDETEGFKKELAEQKQRLQEEQALREDLETELCDAHKIIDSFEKMLSETEKESNEPAHDDHALVVRELEEKLNILENQLDQERVEQKRLTRSVAIAEKKIAEQDALLEQAAADQEESQRSRSDVVEEVVATPSKAATPLPHELRPEPKAGAIFRPDWDLHGLPCRSAKQVLKAWETVFNVQIAMEGYPSQYCMAFLVLLRLKKQKKLYILYRLKKDKHTLVCVPTKTPKDEASLQEVIYEGLKFLKLSGFEMEKMSPENIASDLKSYFLEA